MWVKRRKAGATNARQSTQASKLAQEGLEIVRNIRDVNADSAVRVGNPACITTPCQWSDLYTAKQFTLSNVYLGVSSSPLCPIAESWCLISTPEPILLGVFSRTVEISDDPLPASTNICSDLNLNEFQTKRVTVAVTWQSPLGTQERKVTSCLTDWQNRW